MIKYAVENGRHGPTKHNGDCTVILKVPVTGQRPRHFSTCPATVETRIPSLEVAPTTLTQELKQPNAGMADRG